MKPRRGQKKKFNLRLPVLIEKGEDGYYIAECPVLKGCYTQGRTIDEALRNIREVVYLILEEKESRRIIKNYKLEDIGIHTVAV